MTKRANTTGPITDIDAILTQYEELKQRDPGAILLFNFGDQWGDHYRVFKEDALELKTILRGTMKSVEFFTAARQGNEYAKIPRTSLECVLARIVKAGKRSAVCERVEGPAPAGAKVERVVTEPPHRITLGYTKDDDGIWLECSCGYRECLDHDPTIMTVFAAARNHHEEALADDA